MHNVNLIIMLCLLKIVGGVTLGIDRDGYMAQTRIAVRSYAEHKTNPNLPERQRTEVAAVKSALAQLSRLKNGDAIVRFLMMYHINKTHTLEDAARCATFGGWCLYKTIPNFA